MSTKKEDGRKNNGGKRREGITQSPKSFRIEKGLIEQMSGIGNINKFVNDAIREKLIREKQSTGKLSRV